MIFAFLTAACGLPGSPAAERQSVGPPGLADLGRVVCDESGTHVLSPRIRAHRDGIHVEFINESDADEFYMRSSKDPGDNHGGFLRSRRQTDVSSHGPGEMLVACFKRGEEPSYAGDDESYGHFEIVDSHDLWVSWDLTCSPVRETTNEPVPEADTKADVFEWFRDRFDLPPGEFRQPGYPETEWKGDPWVLAEEGETIANIHPWETDGEWDITTGAACTS